MSEQSKHVMVVAAAVGVMVLGGLITMMSQVQYANSLEELLRQDEQTYVAKLDKIVRVISSQHQIASEYPEQLRQVVQELASARTGGSLAKSVTEQNAGVFDSALLRRVQQQIEINRSELEASFRAYSDHAREYNTLIRHPLWGLMLGGRKPVYPEPIISDRAAQAQRTRRDNRSDLDGDLSGDQ